ncbi:MAG: hypothetical protein L0211_14020 [Planctomycetaceae bacterium]|nr:hypothetical protein [Planctomycetaceae bacterium]
MTKRIVVCALLSAAFIGCSPGSALYPVSGTVTLDGAPLPEGDITFISENPSLGPEQGKIKDGKYEFKSREGKMKVTISASKIKPGGALGAGGEPVAEEYLPAKYNDATILTADVKPSGENKVDFALDSK